ncbi:MAG TPA: hypothetical protein DCX95_00480 [Elusimicrobia bacterium]|nr:hypothetical protein [Elusimicrobiota bacterium]
MKKFFGMMVLLFGLGLGKVHSHYLWLNVDNYNPPPGEEITISVGWGHKFPKDGEAKASGLDKLFVINPQGKTIPLEIKSNEKELVEPVKIKLKDAGTYLIVLTKKSGFSSKTTKGYRYKSKKELEKEGFNVLNASWSEGVAKAIVNVGAPESESFKKEIENRFQVVPLQNPKNLKKGDVLSLKVILKDKPEGEHSAFVYATYSGFSNEKDNYCCAVKPDKNDIAKIKILQKGIWLVYAPQELKYPKPDEADRYSYTDTLTFEVK